MKFRCAACGKTAEEVNLYGVCVECQMQGREAPSTVAAGPVAAPVVVAEPIGPPPATPPEEVKAVAIPAQGIAERRPIAMEGRGVILSSFEDLYRFAQAVSRAGMTPKGMDKPEAVALAVQAGMELGFSPMRALSVVSVINGRVSLMGTAALGKIRQSGLLKPRTDILDGIEGDGDQRTAWVETWRVGSPAPIRRSFSVADAKAAGLWRKTGPWTTDPEMMLYWRAVGRTAKQDWSDVLLGLELAEVAQDLEPVRPVRSEPPGEPDPLLEIS